MTDSELQRLASALGITLPAPYVEIMRRFPDELRHWPAWAASEGSRTFFAHVDVILDVNTRIRANSAEFVRSPKELRAAWPKNLFVFGCYDDESFYVIDVNEANPLVNSLSDGAIRPAFGCLASLYRSYQYRHGQSWEKDEERAKSPRKPPKSTLSYSEFLAEARHLARPAVALSTEGHDYAASWRGTGVVSPPEGEWEHWISLDTRLLPENPHRRRGVMSVYLCLEDGERFHQVAIMHDGRATLPRETDGECLYAHPIACLPHIDAIFRYGREPIENWLTANEWTKERPYDSSFPDSAPVEQYSKVLRKEHPFFHDEEFYAMLGGWSLVSYEDWPRLAETPLLLLTLRESEPWLEVYDGGSELVGYSRIT